MPNVEDIRASMGWIDCKILNKVGYLTWCNLQYRDKEHYGNGGLCRWQFSLWISIVGEYDPCIHGKIVWTIRWCYGRSSQVCEAINWMFVIRQRNCSLFFCRINTKLLTTIFGDFIWLIQKMFCFSLLNSIPIKKQGMPVSQ